MANIETFEEFREWFRRKESRERRDDGRATLFDGATNIITAGTITGLVASNSLTMSLWVISHDPLTTQTLIDTTAAFGGFKVTLEPGPRFRCVAKRADGTTVLDISGTPAQTGIGDEFVWHNILFSFELSGTPEAHLWVDDALQATTETTLAATETVDWSQMDEWFVGADSAGGVFFNGGIYEVWLQPGTFMDFSDINNRRQFITTDLNPQILGPHGRRPLGVASLEKPYIYLHGAPEDIRKNRGDMAGTIDGDFNLGSTSLGSRSGPPIRPRFKRVDPRIAFLCDFESASGLTPIIGPALSYTRADTTATYFDENGVMQTADTDEPRLDHDPATGARLGLLVEPPISNICLQSRTFNNAVWSDTATVTADTDIGLDGTMLADTVEDDDGAVSERLTQSISQFDDSLPYCFSIYIKKTVAAATHPLISVELTGGVAVSGGVHLQTDTGVLTDRLGVVPDDSGVVDSGDYWRVWITNINNSTGNANVNIEIFPAVNTDGSNTIDATQVGSIVCWGAQLERNRPTPTSFLLTTTGPVFRAQEFPQLNGIVAATVAGGATAIGEMTLREVVASATIISLDDATFNETTKLFVTGATFITRSIQFSGGANQVDFFGGPAWAVDARHRFGVAMATDDYRLSQDGTNLGSDVSVTQPLVTALKIGWEVLGSNVLFGHYHNITLYDERLSDDEFDFITFQKT